MSETAGVPAAPAPQAPAPQAPGPQVAMDGDSGLPWVHVSPRLATARTIALLLTLLPFALASGAVAVFLWRWAWVGVAALALLALWGIWLIRRQVAFLTYAELPEEIAIRRGRMFRTLVTVPYGRMQYVDMQSGPLARRFGLASVEIHTASPSSGGDIPGLPVAEAEALRERLAARGESQRAGL
ncbi:MAG: PH domain-containing protein [Micrococcales bacterium]|nr:PH domain-containing protein [Micrococcales bacterium]